MRRVPTLLLFLLLSGGVTSVAAWTGDQETPHLLEIDTPDKGYLHFPVRILDRSTREALTIDPHRDPPATISYSLTRDGTIRIRAVWRRDPELVLRTLLDWTHQEFGRHQVAWDGRDASGNVVDNRGALITFEGDDPAHRDHAPADCHEPELELSTLPSGGRLAELSRIEARISRGTAFGRRNGYTVRCYLDYEQVGEMHVGDATGPFGLSCDAPAGPGEHLLILNLDDGAGHVGVAGLSFRSAGEAADVAAGRRLFSERGCDLCHDLDSTAWSEEGPGLAYLGSRRPRAWVHDVIQTPRAVNRTAAMPEDPLSEGELALMLAFLGSLERPAGPPRTGAEVYRQEGCFDCHEVPSATGAMAGPHLMGIGALRSRAYLERVVLHPDEYFPRTAMPPTLLPPPELAALVSYLQEELDAPPLGPPASSKPATAASQNRGQPPF